MKKRKFFVNEIFEGESKKAKKMESLIPSKSRPTEKAKVKRKFSKKLLLIPLFIVLAAVSFTRF